MVIKKKKIGENAQLCYKNKENFIFYIKTEGIYTDTAKDAETRFDTSNY